MFRTFPLRFCKVVVVFRWDSKANVVTVPSSLPRYSSSPGQGSCAQSMGTTHALRPPTLRSFPGTTWQEMVSLGYCLPTLPTKTCALSFHSRKNWLGVKTGERNILHVSVWCPGTMTEMTTRAGMSIAGRVSSCCHLRFYIWGKSFISCSSAERNGACTLWCHVYPHVWSLCLSFCLPTNPLVHKYLLSIYYAQALV